MTNTTHQHTLLSVSETIRVLGIGRTNLYSLINTGRIKALKLGRRTLISSTEIERFLAGLPDYQACSDEVASGPKPISVICPIYSGGL
jgi:excisionase family DNA binding protein